MSETNTDFNYSQFESTLQKGNADYLPAESQAIACGMLVVNISADKLKWVQLLVGDIDPNDSAQHTAIAELGQLFDLVKQQLQDSNLAFDLLLPDDNVALTERVKAIQEWCSGFLLGISLAGVQDQRSLPEDTRDLLADFTEIGTSGDFDLDDENESEEALAEIVEYIRMGVLLINEEFQPLKQSSLIH